VKPLYGALYVAMGCGSGSAQVAGGPPVNLTKLVGPLLTEAEASDAEDKLGALIVLLEKKAKPPVIERLVGREVLDSRGNPTVEVDVYVRYLNEVVLAGRSSAPSGASTGSNEARELRDSSSKRYGGKGTATAASNVTNLLSPRLAQLRLTSIHDLDRQIRDVDGTPLKEKIGGNATTATSFALAEAGASLEGVQLFEYFARNYYGAENVPKKFKLPSPFFNILNGGKHAGGNLKIQEFMIAPSQALPFPEQLRVAAEVYQKLGGILSKAKGVSAKNLGDEGGFAPPLETPEEAIGYIEEAVVAAGYAVGEDVQIGLDAAASEFYDASTGEYEVEVGVKKTGTEMVEYWAALVDRHPGIVSIEDGLHEKDYVHWVELNGRLGGGIQLVGDDLYTTNPKTIKQGLEHGWCNALLLKVNQIGTITEAMDAARLVLDKGQKVMVSHRSGETCNSVIADLAVGIGAQYIKTGSTARGERIQKYTRLLQIYDYLKEHDLLAE
jgi:enolase